MATEIRIELNTTGAVGTRAIVTKTRFLRRPSVDTFLCHAAGPVMGGQWINERSGGTPSLNLQAEINDAARAAVNLAKFATSTCGAK